MKHGHEFTKTITVGARKFTKSIKYCAVHGEIDLFLCGGVIPWQRIHGRCGKNAPARPAINFQQGRKAA